ncbi:hypothetical protein NECAME_03174 [Necator americanus]|uniref:Tyrosinase copper-binding domain-containing protein n=1 Tax=Necator americanus TaxID=51031 RepID=W2T672_NECAM|nr:hypothetical protein NECAME_03174 [Necator americanus]ETN77510.1 hypothetical protein NECAME_03174 [Necator americanus]
MILLLVAQLVHIISTQNPCFTTNLSDPQQLVCNQIKAWDAASRMQDIPTQSSLTPAISGVSQPLALSAPTSSSGTSSTSLPTDRYQCFTLQCLIEIGIRTSAVTVNGQTTYPYANTFVPYWDSTLDDNINLYMGISSSNSMIFSADLLGSVISGDVVDGQFANFVGTIGEVTQRSLDQYPGQLYLFQAATLNTIVTQQTLNQGCPAVPNSNIELRHGDVHVWIGGFMQTITTSTNDPIFFLHHSFMDFIWEQWRLNKQTRAQRETQWNTGPTSCYSAAHLSTATMTPFT